MEIKSLIDTDYNTVFEAFNRAFEDYEMQLDKVQLAKMLKRRGYDPALSFAAFEGEEIIGFTLNGTGSFNTVRTAYDTGTGTLKEHRGKGLATRIFEHSIPYLKQAGIVQYLLEVLQHNTAAVSVYRKLGFESTREFCYWGQENGKITAHTHANPYSIRQINTSLPAEVSEFWDFNPSWQNSNESVRRAGEELHACGAFERERLVGYCIFEPASGDITQIAVDKNYRRKGIGTSLLRHIISRNINGGVKVVNTDAECHSIKGFLEANNIALRGKQFEMIKVLQ